jgi:hypothetical protein
MNSDESFLHQESAALERFLLQHARRDRAPRGASERALAGLAALSLATGVTASAKLAWGASAASQVTPWVVAKWIAVGMSASVLTFGAAEGLLEAFSDRETSGHERRQSTLSPPARQTAEPQSVVRSELALATPVPSRHPSPPGTNARARPTETSAPLLDSSESDASSASGSVASGAAAEQLSREVTRLRRARAALVAGAPATALEVLNGYALEFPLGTLRAEAAALRIEALAAQGERATARRLASEFLGSYPASPLAARVRQISGLAAAEQKP